MSADTALLKYTGATPGADSNTYSLFDTTVAFPAAGFVAMNRMKRLQLALVNSAAGTLNWYKSQNRGTTWTKIGTQAAGAISAGSENDVDFLIEEYQDFKLEFVNSGSAQTTWLVDMALSGERVKST